MASTTWLHETNKSGKGIGGGGGFGEWETGRVALPRQKWGTAVVKDITGDRQRPWHYYYVHDNFSFLSFFFLFL